MANCSVVSTETIFAFQLLKYTKCVFFEVNSFARDFHGWEYFFGRPTRSTSAAPSILAQRVVHRVA